MRFAAKVNGFVAVAMLAMCTVQAAVPIQEPASLHVPLCAGLTIVTAVSQREGDYESIKRVESVTRDGVRIKYSSEAMVKDETGRHLWATCTRGKAPPPSVYQKEFQDQLMPSNFLKERRR